MSRGILVLWMLFLFPKGVAHEMRPAYLEVTELPQNIVRVSLQQPRVNDRFLDLQLSFTCAPMGEPSVQLAITSVRETHEFNCERGLGGERLTILGLDRTMTNALLRFMPLSRPASTMLIHPDEPTFTFGERAPLPAYLALGVEHLLLGFDHVLFVLGLLFLVSGRWRLVRTITSFTLAHSITLALSVTGLVTLSQGMVEALIALTILYLAVEISVTDRPMEYPEFIAFVFGLLHGLGFAGALREIGLPDDAIFASLLLFNVGIEIGQLLVIAVALTLAALARRSGMQSGIPHLRWIPVYAMGSTSVYWVITRTMALLDPTLLS